MLTILSRSTSVNLKNRIPAKNSISQRRMIGRPRTDSLISLGVARPLDVDAISRSFEKNLTAIAVATRRDIAYPPRYGRPPLFLGLIVSHCVVPVQLVDECGGVTLSTSERASRNTDQDILPLYLPYSLGATGMTRMNAVTVTALCSSSCSPHSQSSDRRRGICDSGREHGNFRKRDSIVSCVGTTDVAPEDAVGVSPPTELPSMWVRHTRVGEVVRESVHTSALICVSTTSEDRP
jgi:hypothetical protein